ncbi:MAG: hypothetical protein HY861_04610 [Chlamydiia bacterium]|nr:hypothetical protein [Chlamydiia bacterium]
MTSSVSMYDRLMQALHALPVTKDPKRDDVLQEIALKIDEISPALGARDQVRLAWALKAARCMCVSELSQMLEKDLPWFERTGRLAAVEEIASQALKLSSPIATEREKEELELYRALSKKGGGDVSLENAESELISVDCDLSGISNTTAMLRAEYGNLCNDPQPNQASRDAFESRRRQFRHHVVKKAITQLSRCRETLIRGVCSSQSADHRNDAQGLSLRITHLQRLVKQVDQWIGFLEGCSRSVDGRQLAADYAQMTQKGGVQSEKALGFTLKRAVKAFLGIGMIAGGVIGCGVSGVSVYNKYYKHV